ncbi:PoNi-like cognate immunity protein [Bacillus toyonensis]|uniref:PoNi-like cognate immunity protein n=1 Tax=Bacillus toyonensis TaxID=155322 RepID=UPI003395A61E
MRNYLCIEEKCREGIEYNKEFIEENREDIKSLEEDTKNGIQRYSKDNKSIIEGTYLANFRYEMEDIRAKYSLGEEISVIEEDFHNAIYDLENTGSREIGYLSLIWMISLGILLETDKKNIENAKTREIIELAQTDKKEASKRLQTYMEKEWFKGHYDYEWKNAHKEPGYVGYWSFETAALVKILELDDTSLKDNNHYPYDLAHYKNEMKYKHIDLSEYHYEDETEEIEDIVEGIENNSALENIIPPKWHSLVNELIHDYENMGDSSFYEKYKKTIGIGQVWFLPQEYEEENEQKNLLGSLIVFALTLRDYILQLDYKEDLEDYIDNLKNFWNVSETKLVQFMLENDQNYYAWVPKEANIPNMYEVKIESVDVFHYM